MISIFISTFHQYKVIFVIFFRQIRRFIFVNCKLRFTACWFRQQWNLAVSLQCTTSEHQLRWKPVKHFERKTIPAQYVLILSIAGKETYQHVIPRSWTLDRRFRNYRTEQTLIVPSINVWTTRISFECWNVFCRLEPSTSIFAFWRRLLQNSRRHGHLVQIPKNLLKTVQSPV